MSAYEKARSTNSARKAKVLRYQRARRAKHPEKYFARQAVANAMRCGRLTKKPCEVCGATEKVEAHHEDYSRPLEVRWLCFFHHRAVAHGQRVIAV